ncbi:MAG: tRNA (adenosine(37)-N6)-threonylcarbamoyltransferase complex transferase subunit TsaD [Patescibacteria group bacterium]
MRILAVETSADETAAAVTEGLNVISSVRITQEIHGQWGGMVPSLAKRDHEKNIDWVIEKAMDDAQMTMDDIDVVAVTQGPGLGIALGVGIAKAKELAAKYSKPLIAVNHIEGHALSAMIKTGSFGAPQDDVSFPCAALVISGGHTQVIEIKEIGKYKILAESLDDNIGEALDKAARMLGLPYPGGAAFEKLALLGNPKKYPLPLPMAGKEDNRFSYSGLKAAFYRLVKSLDPSQAQDDTILTQEQKQDLAASFQAMVFKHVVRITSKVLSAKREALRINDLLVGGGVAANMMLRDKLCEMGSEIGVSVRFPENMMLCTDNAAMIGVVAGFKAERGEYAKSEDIDRMPRWRVDASYT